MDGLLPLSFVSFLWQLKNSFLFSPGPRLSLIKRISLEGKKKRERKLLLIISHCFGVKKTVKINNGYLGKDYSEYTDFLDSPSHAKPLSRWLMDSLAKVLAYSQRFILFTCACLHYFFHQCDMVQSFSSILSLVIRIYIPPLALMQNPTSNLISHIV